jgi:hypothetical protein
MTRTLKQGNPKWLLRIFHQEFPDRYAEDGTYIRKWTDAGIDHARTYRDKIAIWQPYYAKSDLGDVLMALKNHNIKVEIHGASLTLPAKNVSLS